MGPFNFFANGAFILIVRATKLRNVRRSYQASGRFFTVSEFRSTKMVEPTIRLGLDYFRVIIFVLVMRFFHIR